jgi:catechol 2,3-dioxygenase-like lactoylglutathione lyase family enzyme
MLAESKLVAFAATSDVAQAKDFYTRVLGLPLLEESPFALVFDANGTMLRVTPVEKVLTAPYTVLGWHVADVAATARGLQDSGVKFERYKGMEQDQLGIWRSPSGAQVAWFKDPDGNILSLTEFQSRSA